MEPPTDEGYRADPLSTVQQLIDLLSGDIGGSEATSTGGSGPEGHFQQILSGLESMRNELADSSQVLDRSK